MAQTKQTKAKETIEEKKGIIDGSSLVLPIGGIRAALYNETKKELEEWADKFFKTPTLINVKYREQVNMVAGIVNEKFETVLRLVSASIPVLLTGPAGSGKNVLCKQVADSLGLDFYYSNTITQEYKLIGFKDAGGIYHETEFYKAFTHGGLFLLDEIDGSIPEALITINAAISNRFFAFPNGQMVAHPDFRIVAAGNTVGTGATHQYTGRTRIDAATLDRFVIVKIDYDTKVELHMANNDRGMVDFAQTARQVLKDNSYSEPVSYRLVEYLASGLAADVGVRDVVYGSIFKAIETEEADRLLKEILAKNTDAKAWYEGKLKEEEARKAISAEEE